MTKNLKLKADFNGLFGDVLCLSHADSCLDSNDAMIQLQEGMLVRAYEDDIDDDGNPDELFAEGTVERSPDWLACLGSKWILKIDENGVRHESDQRSPSLNDKSEPDI